MNNATKRYNSALLIPILLVQLLHSSSPIQVIPKSPINYNCKNITDCEVKYSGRAENTPTKIDITDIFFRNAKSRNQSPLLSIDLSQLRGNAVSNSGFRFKPPSSKMLGVDISVLSRNPDPILPIARIPPENIINGKQILNYKIDPIYDRFPVSRYVLNRKYPSMPPIQNLEMKPLLYLPLKVIRTHHSILADKKHDSGFNLQDEGKLGNTENEQKYVSTFLLHLLHQLSSHH